MCARNINITRIPKALLYKWVKIIERDESSLLVNFCSGLFTLTTNRYTLTANRYTLSANRYTLSANRFAHAFKPCFFMRS